MVLLEGENPWQETATNSVITNPLLDSKLVLSLLAKSKTIQTTAPNLFTC